MTSRRPRSVPALRRGAFLSAMVVLLLLALVRLERDRSPWSADEVDLTSAAVAMTRAPEAWLRPDYHPFRPEAHRALGAGLVAPPLAAILIALPGLLAMGSWAWPLLGALVLLAGLAQLTRALVRVRRREAWAAAALVLLLSPRLLLDLLTLEAEVPLAGFGCLALAVALSRRAAGAPAAWAAVSGALLGLAFLCKLWLVLPLALATLLAWATRRPLPRARVLAAFVASALLVSSAHLVAVALLDPGSLSRWLREVYLSVFGTSGVASTKWAGVAAHPEWQHGAWYYPLAIPRELGLGAPLAGWGAWRLWRAWRRRPESRRAHAAAALGLGVGLAALSVPAVKEPLYVLSVVAACASLGAASALVLLRRVHARRWPLALVGLGAAAVAFGTAPPRGPAGDPRQPQLRLRGVLPYLEATAQADAPGEPPAP